MFRFFSPSLGNFVGSSGRNNIDAYNEYNLATTPLANKRKKNKRRLAVQHIYFWSITIVGRNNAHPFNDKEHRMKCLVQS